MRGKAVNLTSGKPLWQGLLMGLIAIASVLSGALGALADEMPSVLVQTSLVPEHPVVGQQVEVRVDVFVDTWFAQAPKFPDIQVEDAIALLPPTATVNLNERINGRSYAGQRRTYFLFPQLPGRYSVPELSITIVPAQPGKAEPESIRLSTEPIDFLAQLPPELAAQGDVPILATPQFYVTSRVKTQTSSDASHLLPLHTGDTLEQTVTMTAADTLASVLPAIAPADHPGLSAYADPPKLTNRFERGKFQASRTEHISYVVQQPGHYALPEQSLVWWNTHTQSLETEVIPAVEIRVSPTVQQWILQHLPWLGGVLIALFGWVYGGRSLLAYWQRLRHQWLTSEKVLWRQLRRACLKDNPEATWQCLAAWLDKSQVSIDTGTRENILGLAHHSSLDQALRELESVLFSEQHRGEAALPWSGQALLAALTQVRHQHTFSLSYPRSTRTVLPPALPSSLPPLNPMS